MRSLASLGQTVLVISLVICTFCLAPRAAAQTRDLTVDVLVNSTNTTGYNISSNSPGEYQRYPERYLEHLQIPYRVIDVSRTSPPDLSSVQLIIAGHKGLNLSMAWQQAITSAVQSGTGFVNLDSDPMIGTSTHMQAIFGSATSIAGTPGTSITLPAAYLADGSTPHYILGLQLRWPLGSPSDASGDIAYYFHADDNGVQGTATSTILLNAQGTPITGGKVLAKIGNDPLITAISYGLGRAVDFGTYDYLKADRFGFVMGIDDLFWRSLVWAARKPFVLRGYPRYFAVQQDDPLATWGDRVGDMLNPTITGNATIQTLTDGSEITIGGPWRVNGSIQDAGLDDSDVASRQIILDYLNAPDSHLRVTPHTVTGGSGGDLYWTGDNPTQLTDSQWLANYNDMLAFQKGNGPNGSYNGGNDFMPFSEHMIPHFWDISNNIGWDLWNLGVRYITEIQQPGVYYGQTPAKTPSQRMPGLRPFRLYEQPPSNGNPNEIYSIYWADDYTIGSRAGLPPKTFFGFCTQLQGAGYPDFDARWPQAANGISLPVATENWEAYAWRFWSGMAPVEIYNHDGGSMDNSTTQERQQFISTLSSWLAARGSQPIFLDDLGAYMHARVKSTLTSAQATSTAINLTFTGNATDMDGASVKTYVYVFYGDDNGSLVGVPGFANGATVSVPNVAPPAISLDKSSITYVAAPGGNNPGSQTITVSNSGTGSLNWNASSSASWLTLTPASGTNTGTVTAAANISGLSQGTYSASITFKDAAASNSPVIIPVTLTIAPPTLTVSKTSLSFSAFQGQGNPASQTLSITNSGSGTVNWTASSNAPWLTLSSTSGTAPSLLNISVNTSGISLGTYNANVTVSSSGSSGSPQTVTVTLTLQGVLLFDNFSSGTLAGLAVSPLGLSQNWTATPGALQYNGAGHTQLYAGNAGWTDYNYQVTFRLSSLLDYPGGIRGRVNPITGAGYIVWFYPNEKLIRLYRNVAWNIDSGVALLGQASVSFDTATHSVNLVFAGTQIQVIYDGNQVISATDASYGSGLVAIDVSNQPITFTNLQVTSSSAVLSTLIPSVSSMNFAGLFNGPSPASQTLSLASSAGSLAWTATTNASWLAVTPTNGTTPANVTVTADTQGLAAGTYSGQILFTALGATNVSQTLSVTLTVTLPPPTLYLSDSNMGFTAVSGQAEPAAQTLTISNLGAGTISWTATTDLPWLTVSTGSGDTPANTKIGINAQSLAIGTYTGHVTVTSDGVANSPQVLTVNLRVLAQDLNESFSSNAAGWVVSPMGHADGWSVSNNIYTYAGFGASQSCTGNANWEDYTFDTGIRFSSLSNYPGGVRARVNPATGAGYALWFYPGSGLVKLYSVGQWNIDSGAIFLAQATLSYDTTTFHDARMDFSGSTIDVYWDGVEIMAVTDPTYTSGEVCLDASNQPVSYNGVQVVANQAPVTLTSSSSGLMFASAGGTNPAAQVVNVTAGGAATSWGVTTSAAWLTAISSTATTPGAVTVSVDVAGLTTGTYNGIVSIYAPGSTNSPLTVPVTLSIQSAVLNMSSTAMTFFGATTLNPEGQILNITNAGTGSLTWTSSSDSSWLTLSPTSGTAPSAPTVNVNSSSLALGSYKGNLTIASPQNPGNPIELPIALQVGTLYFNDTFATGTGNWTVSPLGAPANWTSASDTYSYNGGGTSNSFSGSQAWTDYNYSVDFKLSSLSDYPGGIRGRVNLTTGAGYGAWLYPAEGVIKLFRIGQWNIDSGFSQLGVSSVLKFDATSYHNLKLDFRGSTISVYYDNILVIQATDTIYTAGAVALDVSNQPIQFQNVVVIGF